MKKRTVTVTIPIVDLVLGQLAYDDANPEVGMGLLPFLALDQVLEQHGLTKDDVPYDDLLNEICEIRRHRGR